MIQDAIMLFPVVLAGMYAAQRTGSSLGRGVRRGTAIEPVSAAQMDTPYYLWTTPAWLAWYLEATQSGKMIAAAG